jgi:putative ABC transport system substrate-binding protein
MRRRQFIGFLGGAAAWAHTASAQQPTRTYRIAFVHPSNPVSVLTETGGIPFYKAFFEELRRLGYVEGRNLAVARYSGETEPNTMRRLPKKSFANSRML